MRYWWVNQNQTYIHEVPGGFLWSPQRNSNGARNQFYENMTLVSPGDIVFSFADTFIKAVGVVIGSHFEANKPDSFGNAGANWGTKGWFVPVEFTVVKNPIRPREFMHLLNPLLPEKYSPLQANGDGLQGVYLASLPHEMGSVLLGLTETDDLHLPVYDLSQLPETLEEQEIILDAALGETEKAVLVLARRGQGAFRSRVQTIEEACRVTGVDSKQLLVASHIKPWSESQNWERINGNNGLFLSPHVDKLFDKGLITFTAKGGMEVSAQLEPDVLKKWHIDPSKNFGKFNVDQLFFLEYHQAKVFQAS